jgi:hypothetical protein
MASINEIRSVAGRWLAPFSRYERHISALAMALGFAFDNYAFGRVDRPGTHIVFGSYLALAIAAIAITHYMQSNDDRRKAARERKEAEAARRQALARKRVPARTAPMKAELKVASEEPVRAALDATALGDAVPVGFDDAHPSEFAGEAKEASAATPQLPEKKHSDSERTMLVAATQFALGALASGFLVFYSRSAVFASSWLFLIVLASFLVGNEIFRRYHSRLVFTALLLFFSLYSYAIFVVPVLTRSIGRVTFLLSGLLAILAFLFFLRLLYALGPARFRQSRWAIFGGAIAITAAMNLFYFESILPPLPLALSSVGIFHSVKHTGATYTAVGEQQTWYANVGLQPQILHVVAGQPVSLYSAVFAPIKLVARITHRWQHYNPDLKRWQTVSSVSFAISGGRDNGFRAYSIKKNPKPGEWRVDILTQDGLLIGRERFTLIDVPKEAGTITKVFN